ncbi:MAG: hypothetical protein QOD72_1739, partial [Acidimicrobiaceae bacterium]|nr:hypothetical protein [Acidimicrobiaceae bacterium]
MHITELLERAAPTPTRPLDVARVLAEARRPRWHKRRWIWVMGLIALGGAAVPAGINLAPASSPATRVETVRPRPEPGDSTRGPSTDVTPS